MDLDEVMLGTLLQTGVVLGTGAGVLDLKDKTGLGDLDLVFT